MESNSVVEEIFQNLNNLRTKPADFVKNFNLVAKGLERFKKKKEGQELADFAKTLSTKPSTPALKFSNGLSRAAQEKLELLKSGHDVHLKESPADLQERYNRHVQNFNEISEISDHGTFDSMLARLMISDHDPQRLYRQTVFGENYNYVGIAVNDFEDEEITVLVFADAAEDKKNASVDELVFKELNNFRRNPFKVGNDVPQESGKDAYNKELSQFKSSLSKVALKPVTRETYLDDLAQLINTNLESKQLRNTNEKEKLEQLAKTTVHGFNLLYARLIEGPTDSVQIVRRLLANPTESNQTGRNAIAEKTIAHVGIFHENHEGEQPRTVIVGVDLYYPGSERRFEEYVTDELNRFRQTPSSYVNDLEAFKHNMECKTYKVNIIKDINGYISELQRTKSLPTMQNNEALNEACKEYLTYFTKGRKRLYAEDDEFLYIRLASYISGYTICKEFVNSHSIRPDQIITEMLVSENDRDKTSRQALQNSNFRFFGVNQQEVNGERITVLIFTDRCNERTRASYTQELLTEINNLRAHPNSYIKHVDQEVENTTGFNRSSRELAAKRITEFLNNTRTLGPFNLNERLVKAAETRVSNFTESNTVINDPEDLRIFLSDFGKDYYFVAQLAGNAEQDKDDASFINPVSFLVRTFLSDSNLESLKAIFNTEHYEIGVAYDKTSLLTVVLLADEFVAPEGIQIDIGDRWKRIRRPRFTQDEVEQMRHDFKQFDVLNQGFIIPNGILSFVNNNPQFMQRNPMYYEALKSLNTVENNEKGVNVNMFMDAVEKAISYYDDANWKNVFEIFVKDRLDSKSRRSIDKDTFVKVAQEIGYNLTDDELAEIWERITEGRNVLDQSEFINIMQIVEKDGRAKVASR